MVNYSQEQIFLFFFIIGIIIGILFDIFRAIRKSFKSSDTITFIQDIIFVGVSGALVIYSIIKLNNGNIRFFLFLGIFLGIIVYSLTISNFCVIILHVFIEVCKKIVKIPYNCIIKILKRAKALIKKDF